MKIDHIALRCFKRFSDLELYPNMPGRAAPRLVLLVGANGAGKSGVLDALNFLRLPAFEQDQLAYYTKSESGSDDFLVHFSLSPFPDEQAVPAGIQVTGKIREGRPLVLIDSPNGEGQDLRQLFFGRSAQRTKGRIPPPTAFEPQLLTLNADGAPLSIDTDDRFNNDIYQLTFEAAKIISQYLQGQRISDGFLTEFVQPINHSLARILGDQPATAIKLVDIQPPYLTQPAKWFFQKGNSKITYDYLSNGEKEVVGQLINWAVRKGDYPNAVFFVDEMDAHLNTALQKALLKEIVTHWLPASAQLWVATHSLGFIEFAHESEDAAILDLDNLDFDWPQRIYPSPKGNLDVYEIAIPKSTLDVLLRDKKIIVCENANDRLYNALALPDCIFVGVANNYSVFTEIKNNPTRMGLRDRDFLSDEEIRLLEEKYPNYRVLRYYCFENYLYHPENLAELCKTHAPNLDLEAYRVELRRQKNEALTRILLDIKNNRKSYQELGSAGLDLGKKALDEHLDEIVRRLQSDEPEDFLRYFDLKHQFKKDMLAPFGLPKETLAGTNWFKSKIVQVLSLDQVIL